MQSAWHARRHCPGGMDCWEQGRSAAHPDSAASAATHDTPACAACLCWRAVREWAAHRLFRFLQCREEWLAELVAELDDSNAYEYVKRLTDVHRLQV